MAVFWRIGAGMLALAVSVPAVAQNARDLEFELGNSAPLARDYCLKQVEPRRGQSDYDSALLDCLRFRSLYPLRAWTGPGGSNYDEFGRPSHTRRPVPYSRLPDPPDRYFPSDAPVRFPGRADGDISACSAENAPAAASRAKAIHDGRALADYRLRVMRMTPAELDAEDARLKQQAGAPVSSADGDANSEVSEAYIRARKRGFIYYARSMAAGEQTYLAARDDLGEAIDRYIARFRRADREFRDGMEACFARREAAARPAPPPVDVAAGWRGIFEGGGLRYTVSGAGEKLSIDYQAVRPGLNQSGHSDCTITAGRAACTGSGRYEDADKSINYTDFWTMTLGGDGISGTSEVAKAYANWKIPSPYGSALHDGATFPIALRRVQ